MSHIMQQLITNAFKKRLNSALFDHDYWWLLYNAPEHCVNPMQCEQMDTGIDLCQSGDLKSHTELWI